MTRVLITGGAGFVGYHLAKRLAGQKGYHVTLADNFFRGRNDRDLKELLKQSRVRFIKADLTDPRAWKKIGSGYDEVYHLVGINGTKLFYEIPQEVLRIGLTTTLNALEWFRTQNKKRNAKILYTSSNEAYASGFDLGIIPIPTPETAPLIVSDPYNPRWSYGGQKLIGELLFINYARAYNLRMAIVRPHNFYGPRAGYEHAIPQMLARIGKREDPFVVYGADETRSFCYIDDAVEAIERVMESEKTDGETYHIGSADETSIHDLAEELFTASGWHPKEITEKKSPEGSVKRRLADVSKIKKDTGWVANTDLATGLKATMAWYSLNPVRGK
jgi:UDP-glucose 4-epimerase